MKNVFSIIGMLWGCFLIYTVGEEFKPYVILFVAVGIANYYTSFSVKEKKESEILQLQEQIKELKNQ